MLRGEEHLGHVLADVTLAAHGKVYALAYLCGGRVFEKNACQGAPPGYSPDEINAQIVTEEYERCLAKALSEHQEVGFVVEVEQRIV